MALFEGDVGYTQQGGCEGGVLLELALVVDAVFDAVDLLPQLRLVAGRVDPQAGHRRFLSVGDALVQQRQMLLGACQCQTWARADHRTSPRSVPIRLSVTVTTFAAAW